MCLVKFRKIERETRIVILHKNTTYTIRDIEVHDKVRARNTKNLVFHMIKPGEKFSEFFFVGDLSALMKHVRAHVPIENDDRAPLKPFNESCTRFISIGRVEC